MSVREKVDICQFEWYRDNEFVCITVSSIELGAVFLENNVPEAAKNIYFIPLLGASKDLF